MKIIEISPYSLPKLKQDYLDLMEKQMQAIGEKFTRERIANALKIALQPNKRAHALMLLSDDNQALGICFFNVCSGIQSGGDYIWLNEIYIDEPYREKGCASYFLKYLEDWAKRNNCVAISAVTWDENLASQGLFKSNGFGSWNPIWVDKKIDFL